MTTPMNNPLLNLKVNQTQKETFAVHIRAGRFTTNWHTHAKHQLLYAEDGILHVQTEQYPFILPARHGAWLPAQCKHRIWSNSPHLYLRTLYLEIDENDSARLRNQRVFALSNLAHEMILHTQIWDRFEQINGVEKSFYQTVRLLAETWLRQPIGLVLPSPVTPQLIDITAYIQENLSEALHLPSVSEKFGFSGRTVLRMFKRDLGMTFDTYLRLARIIRATELLTRTDISITEVAYAVGYQSLSSFSHTFRNLVGLSPQEYLKRGIITEREY